MQPDDGAGVVHAPARRECRARAAAREQLARQAPSNACSRVSMPCCATPAISRWAGRSSTRPWCRPAAPGSRTTRRRQAARSAQHRQPGLGRYRLPLGGQPRAVGPARAGAAVAATETARPADAGAHRPRQRQPGTGSGRHRARVRCPEVPARRDRPLGRARPRDHPARARQSGHQHDPPRLVGRPSRTGLTAALPRRPALAIRRPLARQPQSSGLELGATALRSRSSHSYHSRLIVSRSESQGESPMDWSSVRITFEFYMHLG